MILIKNIEVFAPKSLGVKDVFIGGNKILEIADNLDYRNAEIIDGKGKILVPGFIDNHVHVTGGGGEAGFFSKAPEVKCSKLIEGGITTVCGLLGTDGATRDIENLVSKLYGLRELGISAYGYTGSYRYPSNTLTGDLQKDIIFLDPIIGVKIALSDHRSSNISNDELARLAADTRVAGMLGKKAGVVIVHMGVGKRGLSPIREILDNSDIPMNVFHPTHCNRDSKLLDEALEFLKVGGSIDLTCGLPGHDTPTEVIVKSRAKDIPQDKITISSDGNGSYSKYDEEGNLTKIGVASVSSLFVEFKELVKAGLEIPQALIYVTKNVAKVLKLDKHKGTLEVGKDADMLIMDSDFNLETVIAMGEILLQDGKVLKEKVIEFD